MPDSLPYTTNDLKTFEPQHDAFVGIDSDGCVFDTMEIKQKQCFHGLIVSHWHLEPIESYVRESAEFVNLYSKWRGTNRFPGLVKLIDLIRERPEVISSGVSLPEFSSLRRFIDSGVPMGNPSLEKAVSETSDPELASVLDWSNAVNASVAKTVKHVPPFKYARESLQKIRDNADSIVVSQTPCEALIREWRENGITDYVKVIAGQELGTKTEHLAMATANRYAPGRVLMIGDAPGDLRAARANDALFFPTCPGHETASWERFYTEAFDRFMAGNYAGEYEQTRIDEFESLLPGTPPWERE